MLFCKMELLHCSRESKLRCFDWFSILKACIGKSGLCTSQSNQVVDALPGRACTAPKSARLSTGAQSPAATRSAVHCRDELGHNLDFRH